MGNQKEILVLEKELSEKQDIWKKMLKSDDLIVSTLDQHKVMLELVAIYNNINKLKCLDIIEDLIESKERATEAQIIEIDEDIDRLNELIDLYEENAKLS